MENTENQEPLKRRRTDILPKQRWLQILRRELSTRTVIGSILAYIVLLFFYYSTIVPPALFPVGQIITLQEGMSLRDAGAYLEEIHVVRSSAWLRNLVIFYSGEKSVLAGDYHFEKPVNIFAIAHRITDKNYQMEPLRITVPEGLSAKEMAALFDEKLSRFNKEAFLEKTGELEGRLFPDTYFFIPTASEDVVIETMTDNFDAKIESLMPEIKQSGHSLNEILSMASILELEATDAESRAIVSGILWKRIKIGMPLQVDASFVYIAGKGSSEITAKDLRSNSPYNSYKFRGLPPGPIANPGLDAIRAAIHPRETPFLYYLSDKDGRMYYAKTFEEHKKNRSLYLE